MIAETALASARPTYSFDRSITRIDIALLASALFLQRFSLSFGKTFLTLDVIPTAFIFLHQFLSGKMVMQYDRLILFVATGLAATCSLLLNFQLFMLTSYFLFLALNCLAMLSRPSLPDLYKSTLSAFQFLVILLSYLAVAQFFAQFVVDGRKLLAFYGLVPDFFFGLFHAGKYHTIHEIEGSTLLKSNGIFLLEPSTLSQITALGILIEVLEFRRLLYLVVITLGFLLAYSGTGLMLLFILLPLAGLRHGKAGLFALLAVIFALGLFATGIVELSVFLSRVGEFTQIGTSGFSRFVSPLWLASKFFDTSSLQAVLVGNGPGTEKTFGDVWYGGGSSWLKLLYEYGIVGSFTFVCFLASCLRKSRCPALVRAAIILIYIFYGGFLTPSFFTLLVVLCTLHSPEPRRARYAPPSSPDPRRADHPNLNNKSPDSDRFIEIF